MCCIFVDLSIKALKVEQSIQKRISRVGEHAEESLLLEKASQEAQLNNIIVNLEHELRLCKQGLEKLTAENVRVVGSAAEQQHLIEELEVERRQLKKDIKEYKFRESRNLADYAELEEENVGLQKQVLYGY